MGKFFIYKITNLTNGKIYIGKTFDIEKRWKKHKVAATLKDPHDYSYLHRAINKYGEEAFSVEELESFESEDLSFIAEQKYIKQYNSNNKDIGYNLTDGGEGSTGYKHTDETRVKLIENNKGKFVGKDNPFFGKTHSPESRQKMGESHKKVYEENGHPWTGRKHSDETKQKISKTRIEKDIRPSEETKRKISEKQKGDIKYITSAKLTENDVREIKLLLSTTDMTHDKIAEKFKMNRATITYIALGKTWRHIQ